MNTSVGSLAVVLVIMVGFGSVSENKSRAAAQDLVEQTCRKVRHYDLCVSSLRSDSRSASADVKGLAGITLDLLKAKGSGILAQVDGMRPNATNEVMVNCLAYCHDQFDEALNQLIPEAMAKLSAGSKVEAMLLTIDTGENANDCDFCFISERFGPSTGPPPFTDEDHVFFYLANVAQDIIGLT